MDVPLAFIVISNMLTTARGVVAALRDARPEVDAGAACVPDETRPPTKNTASAMAILMTPLLNSMRAFNITHLPRSASDLVNETPCSGPRTLDRSPRYPVCWPNAVEYRVHSA